MTNVLALVVEDDPPWQGLLSELLRDIGLNVEVASALESAVTLIRAQPHRLAVVDLSLGGRDHRNQDGLRVLEALQRHDPGCVSILVSGFATVEIAVAALKEYGAFSCLRKEAFHRGEFRDLVHRALASAPPTSAVNTEIPLMPPARVLLVEDDAGWRSILTELLSDAGHMVQTANSFGEAWGYLRRGEYQLAVVDLSLARASAPHHNLDGMRLLEALHASQVPAIVVSGVATPEDIEYAYSEYHIFACLEKQTFDRHTFLRIVTEALQANRGDEACPPPLTAREWEVLQLVARGLSNKEIAQVLVITPNTVKRHLKSIFAKLDVHTRAAAVAWATQRPSRHKVSVPR
ncbi:MAG: response regulator [Anaerolineae bacterium]|nr:response regulator [Anaerolineae bacterium]MDW8070843.1 response regulator [Anaerolineae bacterium]